MKTLFYQAFGVLFGGAIVLTVAFFAFEPPISLVWESIDLVRMREVTSGRILSVSYERGGRGGASRARIQYTFSVQDQEFQSERYLPGFAANHSKWTGGDQVGHEFPVGSEVPVYYNAADPTLCALEYGWFKWTVATCLGLVGLITIGLASSRWKEHRFARWIWYLGVACIATGAGELVLRHSAIRVRELHWHVLAFSAVILATALYAWAERNLPRPMTETIASSEQIKVHQRSTPMVVFEFICGIVLLVVTGFQIIPSTVVILRAYFRTGVMPFGVSGVILIAFNALLMGIIVTGFVVFSGRFVSRVAWHWSNRPVRGESPAAK